MSRTRMVKLALLLVAFVAHVPAVGQDYPTRIIRLVVPYPPGGSVDVVSRLVGQKLAELLGQQVVIENRGGASGSIGATYVAKAASDGHTLLMGGPTVMATNPNMNANLAYHPVKDFSPIMLLAHQPNVLLVHPVVPANNVKELIALTKAKPGKLTVATSGAGGSQHMAIILFTVMTGATFTDIPYKGGAPARIALIGGEVDVMFQTLITEIDLIKSGRIRALAVTTMQRSPALPDTPTLTESGVAGYSFHGWHGVLAPAATPKHIITRLNKDIGSLLDSKELRKQFLDLGLLPIGGNPDTFAIFLREEIEKYAKLVKAAKITVQ